jgi:SMI1/KNR4 family protein SUKH-1
MVVNGLKLPDSFVEFRHRDNGRFDWTLKGDVDAYGRPCGLVFFPYRTPEEIEWETSTLAEYFSPVWSPEYSPADEERRRARCEAELPGFLPDITDFSKIVWFGRTPTGCPVCFDFRENLQEPSIIYCPDMYSLWRRVAPDFETLVALLEPNRPSGT